MPKIPYRPHRFRAAQLQMIDRVNQIVTEYERQGFVLSLRQAYYALVSKDIIPNTVRSYKNLGVLIDAGRLAGLIDWDMFEDRSRHIQGRSHFDTPGDVIAAAYHSYRLDRWEDQKYRVFCLIEKDALAGVFSPVCRKWDVPLLPCRGYTSQSQMWRLAMQLIRYEDHGQTSIIIHFGDHDPSGVDMTRDIQTRLAMFGCGVTVNRLALNMDQVEQYNPPPNPAKQTDARFQAYMESYGDESWELDALEPTVLAQLVEDAIAHYRDPDKWKKTVEREIEERALLKVISDKWSDVKEHVEFEYPTTIAKAEGDLQDDPFYKDEMED